MRSAGGIAIIDLDMDTPQYAFPSGNDELVKLQQTVFEMALAIKTVFDRHHIRYVIEYGSLLGAVRHGGFIPWDDDFDYVVWEEDYERASLVLRQELPDLYLLHDKESDPNYYYSFSKVVHLKSEAIAPGFTDNLKYKGISIDLFKGKVERNNKYARRLFVASNHLKSHGQKCFKLRNVKEFPKCIYYLFETVLYGILHLITPKKPYFHKSPDTDQYFIPEDEYLPVSSVLFEGESFPAPRHPEFVLEDRYGKKWKLPPDKIEFHISGVRWLE